MNESPREIVLGFIMEYGILTIGAVLLGFIVFCMFDLWPVIQIVGLVIVGILYGWLGATIWRNDFDDD